MGGRPKGQRVISLTSFPICEKLQEEINNVDQAGHLRGGSANRSPALCLCPVLSWGPEPGLQKFKAIECGL